jgi:hypothetical protein
MHTALDPVLVRLEGGVECPNDPTSKKDRYVGQTTRLHNLRLQCHASLDPSTVLRPLELRRATPLHSRCRRPS